MTARVIGYYHSIVDRIFEYRVPDGMNVRGAAGACSIRIGNAPPRGFVWGFGNRGVFLAR
jgi:hypothetical protein